MFKRILVGVKHSESGQPLLKKAIQLAHIHGASLHVLHVMDYNLKRLPEGDPELKQQIDDAQVALERLLQALTAEIPVESQCRPGDPAMDVCRTAIDIQADLILLGCHKRPDETPIVRVDYVGSTILEKSPCPVLLVPFVDE